MWMKMVSIIVPVSYTHLLYVCCVVLPVALTDSVVVGMIFSEEPNARKQVTENIASVAEYSIDKAVEELSLIHI